MTTVGERASWLLARYLIVLLFCHMGASQTLAQATPSVPPGDGPVEVKIKLLINKIYNIDTIAETYVIDGYFVASWRDQRLARREPGQPAQLIYFNEKATDKLGSEIWWPMFEFINIVGMRGVPNREVEIDANGKVTYSERFNATFTSDMDFRKYPFDSQTFKIKLESFTYNRKQVVFVSDEAMSDHGTPSDEWAFEEPEASISLHVYSAFPNPYSRYVLSLVAKRKHGYFVWQFFFPLFMIVVASWIVFWISDFGNQLGTAFTLMLTVVAFNFYVSTLLPRLPYNTFIEIAIISGYVAIFLTILAIVLHRQVVERGHDLTAKRLVATTRWLFPVGYVLAMIGLKQIFLG